MITAKYLGSIALAALLPAGVFGLSLKTFGLCFGAGTAIFVLQPVIPPGHGVGIPQEQQWRVVFQPLLLQGHDVAVLVQEGADDRPQKGLQRR